MKILCTEVHYGMNYMEENVIALIVKEIMYILTIGYKEKHVKTKQKLSDMAVIFHLPVSPPVSLH